MKTIKKVEYRPEYVEHVPPVGDMVDNVIYVSERFQIAIHKCLCGCGDETVMPFRNGGWNLIKHEDGKISFTPSVSNYQSDCKSHYIMTKNIANFV